MRRTRSGARSAARRFRPGAAWPFATARSGTRDWTESSQRTSSAGSIQHEPSAAVRSVFGRSFRDLVFADEDWARAHRDQIFPLEGEPALASGLGSYIRSAIPAAVLFELLEAQYRRAIEELTPVDVEGR